MRGVFGKKKWEMGKFFVFKKWKWGCFCKKWTFPQRRVHYVQYQYFLFHILLTGGAYAPNAPPAYGPELAQSLTIVRYTDPRTHSLNHSLPGLAVSNAKI